MEKAINKLFGGLKLTYPKVIAAAVAAAVLTAAIALIPAFHYTSFIAITVTLEVWIFFGILIIVNSRSNLDAAIKCFLFFLISQPLVYLIQVPFSELGWTLFGYYRYWFIWTLLCFPMGFVGYYMKKDTWWGYLILFPMVLLTGYSYLEYFSDFQFSMPRYLLIVLFCACAMILYPVFIFRDSRIRIAGAAIGGVLVAALTVVCLLNPPVYTTEIAGNGDEYRFDGSYSVSLADEKFGTVEIRYLDSIDTYVLHADFRRSGDTVLTLVSPEGEKTDYKLHIERDRFEIEPD
ncbi:MAG: hypothetical protein J5494_03215 [Candidatus Methanomethylophilaceae archaeon]|nr:hypothetical protein [Candidatus Methanomethylophilaceae archaeon]